MNKVIVSLAFCMLVPFLAVDIPFYADTVSDGEPARAASIESDHYGVESGGVREVYPDGYEPDDSATSYTAFNVFTTDYYQIHTLHSVTDQDWYRFYGTAGWTYTFWSTGITDDIIYLYQDNGTTLIASDDQSGVDNNYLLSFTPSATAFYKLKVVGYNGAMGMYYFYSHYTVPADGYEPDDTSDAATSINPGSVNQVQYHTLHINTDQDWYVFHGHPGRYYTFYSTYNTNTSIYLYQDDGSTLLDWVDDGGEMQNFYLRFTPTAHANYRLMVEGSGGATGYYEFNFSCGADPDAYEPDNDPASALGYVPTFANTTQNHSIHSAGDADWFRMSLFPGRFYRFSSSGYTDTRIFLYQEDGSTLLDWDDNNGGEGNFELLFSPSAQGFYYLKVDANGGDVGAYGFNYLYESIPDSYEPDNSSTQYNYIVPSSIVQNQMHTIHEYTDQDWYRFYGYSGRIYHFESQGYTDMVVILYAEDGSTILASNNLGGPNTNFLLEFEPSADAYYMLQVYGRNLMIGAYSLCYYYRQNEDGYEPDNSSTQYTELVASPSSQIQVHTLHDNNDQDWFRFYAYEGRIYHFESTGNTDNVIYLYFADGTTLYDSDDDSGAGSNFMLDFGTPSTGYYLLKVVPYAGNAGIYYFNYHYWVHPDPYEPDDTPATSNELTIEYYPQNIYHTIHTLTDVDWYRFYGVAGRTYHFSSSGSTDVDCFLYQDNGTTLIDNDSEDGEGFNFSLLYTPTVSNWYKLKVTSWNGLNNGVGAYALCYYYTSGLPAPTNVQITSSAPYIVISWNPVTGATGYVIQASVNPYSGFSQIGTSSTHSWTGGTTSARRFYRVIAVN